MTALLEAGASDEEIAEALGIYAGTVGLWREATRRSAERPPEPIRGWELPPRDAWSGYRGWLIESPAVAGLWRLAAPSSDAQDLIARTRIRKR